MVTFGEAFEKRGTFQYIGLREERRCGRSQGGDVVMFEGFVGGVAPPGRTVRMGRVSEFNTRAPEATEETGIAMVMDKTIWWRNWEIN